MKFKEFLAEESYKTKIDKDKAKELIFGPSCSDFMSKSADKPIIRGMDSANSFYTLEGEKGGRKSRNTTNHYTVILDEFLPEEGYPRRSKSIICASWGNRFHAAGYGTKFAIIPLNGTKIGVCEGGDIFDSAVTLFGETRQIFRWNKIFSDYGISDASFGMLVSELSGLVESYHKAKVNGFKSAEDFEKNIGNAPAELADESAMANYIKKAYTKIPFQLETAKSMENVSPFSHELWIGQKVVAVEYGEYVKMMRDQGLSVAKWF